MDSIKKYIEQNRKNLFRDPYMQSTLNVLFEREVRLINNSFLIS